MNLNPALEKCLTVFIQRHLFAWKNLGNAKNCTEEQEHLPKLKTSEFLALISPDDIICSTDGSVTDLVEAESLGLNQVRTHHLFMKTFMVLSLKQP